jgi:hypothetical protein
MNMGRSSDPDIVDRARSSLDERRGWDIQLGIAAVDSKGFTLN